MIKEKKINKPWTVGLRAAFATKHNEARMRREKDPFIFVVSARNKTKQNKTQV